MQGPTTPGDGGPLRIVAVVGDFPATSKTFVMDQVTRLLDAGHDVTILAEPPRPGEDLDPRQVPTAVTRALSYRRRPPESRLARRVHGLWTLLRALRHAPAAAVRLLTDRALPLGRRRELLDLLPIVRRIGPADVYHCHFGTLGRDVVEVRDHLGFDGIVATAFHGFDVSRDVDRFGPRVFERLFASGELFLPISDHWRARLVELGAPPERVHVHRMGVDVTAFTARERQREPDEPLRVLSIGRLVEKKGTADGIASVARLRDRGVPVRYRIIGSGPLGDDLRAQIRELDLDAQVELLGSRSRDEVQAQLGEADVLLCPSVTARDGDTEGIPMVLMEAMATAVPVVSTWHSGIPELVEHDRSGLLAAERDPDALADHLETLWRDPSRGVRLGRQGRRRVEQDFDLDVLAVRLVERFRAARERWA